MTIMSIIITEEDIWKKLLKKCSTPQATDKFNPKVNPQTCFWADFFKIAQKQNLESTKRKKVKNKKNVANVII